MKNLLAQISSPLGKPLEGIGPLGLEGETGESAPGLFNKFISSAIGIMTIIAFIWFLFKFITGAIGIISAGSDKQALENAKNNITMGIVGVVVVIAAVFVIDLVGNLLGIPNILNPADLLEKVLIFK